MRIGAFEINEPLPDLVAPHVIATLRPWVDCGSIGTLILQRLETRFRAQELARLARPGNFYDFTRYRPLSYYKQDVRELIIPNTTITYARTGKDHDFVFLHLLEPHMLAESYTGSVWQVLKTLCIQRYCLLGSFYDAVPHTRPMLVSGGSSRGEGQANFGKIKVLPSHYEGPTTICNLISQQAEKAGIETMTFMVHLPDYLELEEDYMGTVALLQILHSLYNIPVSDTDIRQAENQLKNIEAATQQDHKLKTLVAQLETDYDALTMCQRDGEGPPLSPEVDRFLKEMENRFKSS